MDVALAPDEPDDPAGLADVSAALAAFTVVVKDAQVGGLAPGVVARVGQARLLEGAALREGVFRAPALELVDVTAEVDLDALLRGGAPVPSTVPGLEVLDAVSGHLRVEATVGLGGVAPRVKNALRLVIREGTVDFRAFERSFHALADAVLNFRLRGSRLELEKDIPFVPWDETTLLAWRLGPDDRALAARDRVRLRRLLEVEVLEAGRRDAGGKGCYALGSLALEDLDLDVSVASRVDVPLAGGAVQLGVDGAAGVQGLRARGAVRCTRDGPAVATEVALSLARASAAARGLHVLGLVVGVERVALADVTGEIAFEGLAPRRLTLRAPRVLLEGLTAVTG